MRKWKFLPNEPNNILFSRFFQLSNKFHEHKQCFGIYGFMEQQSHVTCFIFHTSIFYFKFVVFTDEEKPPMAFLTEAGKKRSADRRLSVSSIDYEEGPSTSTASTSHKR